MAPPLRGAVRAHFVRDLTVAMVSSQAVYWCVVSVVFSFFSIICHLVRKPVRAPACFENLRALVPLVPESGMSVHTSPTLTPMPSTTRYVSSRVSAQPKWLAYANVTFMFPFIEPQQVIEFVIPGPSSWFTVLFVLC
jgi:hypothetical protein